jgi:predicted acyl esterase
VCASPVQGARPGRPELSFGEERRLTPGQAVEAVIALWPTAMRWHAGEQLRLRVSGRTMLPTLFPGLPEDPYSPVAGVGAPRNA